MLLISPSKLRLIQEHGESAYPNEGAGVLLGRPAGEDRQVVDALPIANQWDAGEQHHRYMITPQDMLRAESAAADRGLDVIGIFHSHPDHPAEPSGFDREWALPWYSYIITSVNQGQATTSRSWQLRADRSAFDEETIITNDSDQEQ